MTTKLGQWLIVAGVIATIWLLNMTGTTVVRDYPHFSLFWPIYLVICFGLASVGIIAKRVYDFNDCKEAAEELQRQIRDAKLDLRSKGLEL